MPFVLCSAPSTFQRCMELEFSGLQWRTLFICLDNIIILGRTMEENLDRLDEALGQLKKANLKLTLAKCKLLQHEALFLSYIVSVDGMHPNPKLIESIHSWDPTQDQCRVQQFLWLCNYYWRFVPDFSVVASPLTDQCRQLTFQHVQDLRKRIHECYELAPEKLRVAAKQQKLDHDACEIQNRFSPGDLVSKINHNHKKLETPMVGVFLVKKLMGDCIYLASSKQKTYVLHHDLLNRSKCQDGWRVYKPLTSTKCE